MALITIKTEKIYQLKHIQYNINKNASNKWRRGLTILMVCLIVLSFNILGSLVRVCILIIAILPEYLGSLQ